MNPIRSTLAAVGAAGVAVGAFGLSAAPAHADEMSAYMGWTGPTEMGECPTFITGHHVKPGGTITLDPGQQVTGWLNDSEVKSEAGDSNTRWVQNTVVEAQYTIVCDDGRGERRYAPTRYMHRFKWTGQQCILGPILGGWGNWQSGCMPYFVREGGWQDGLSNAR